MHPSRSSPRPDKTHECEFRESLEWGEWSRAGNLLNREGRRITRCIACGAERPSRRPRPISAIESKAAVPGPAPAVDRDGRRVAAWLLSRGSAGKGGGAPIRLRGPAGDSGFSASLAEEWIENFLRAGWVETQYGVSGSMRRLREIRLSNSEALEEYARPGRREEHRFAIAEALDQVKGLGHPVVEQVSEILKGPDAGRLPPVLVKALAAVAVLADSGETLARRVFSARFLGDSKALDRVLRRVEQILGPIETYGIREGGAVMLAGGGGIIETGDQILRLERLSPFVGLSRETVIAISRLELPEQGLLVVENLAVFEACCRGEVSGTGAAMVVWAAGYPGRSVRKVVDEAAKLGAEMRVWADLDLDGVRIARIVNSWSGGRARPWRMDSRDLEAACATIPLTARATAAIRADLESHEGELLADTLCAILSKGRWAEQEALLASFMIGAVS